MAIIRITDSHCLTAGVDVEKDAIIEVSDQVAAQKFRQKYAVPATPAEITKFYEDREKAAAAAVKADLAAAQKDLAGNTGKTPA